MEEYSRANTYLDGLKGPAFVLVSCINVALVRSSPYSGMFLKKYHIESPTEKPDIYFFFIHAVATLNHFDANPSCDQIDVNKISSSFVNVKEALDLINKTTAKLQTFLRTFIFLLQDFQANKVEGVFDLHWAIQILLQSIINDHYLETIFNTPSEYNMHTPHTSESLEHGFDSV